MKSGFLVFSGAVIILSGCTQKTGLDLNSESSKRLTALENRIEELKPGLGEIMSVIQQHHAKLYFAGKEKNWQLAEYQLDEINEGLEDAAKFHPTFKSIKASLADLIPAMTKGAIAELSGAIKSQSKTDFEKGFQSLTTSCNRCHQATDHSFIVIQVPSSQVFSNQRFSREGS